MRHLVVVSLEIEPQVVGGRLVEYLDGVTVIGPFRSKARAERRAAVIRKLADTYEDPEGVTGENNAVHVSVVALVRGAASAQAVMDVVYGSIPADEA